MPISTNTLERTVLFARRFVDRIPLTYTGTNDPAMFIGDWVRNTILQPPFAWRWNRVEIDLPLVAGQQDYSINLPTFGWLESATVIDTVSTPNAAYRLGIELNPGKEIVQNQPSLMSARVDDGNGNITFRMAPPPTANFTTSTLTYQNASPKFTGLNQTWAPIPDYMSNLYTMGFLAQAYNFLGDERYAPTLQMFVRSLVATHGGLTQSQINIFMAEVMLTPLTQQNMSENAQFANQSRNLL